MRCNTVDSSTTKQELLFNMLRNFSIIAHIGMHAYEAGISYTYHGP